MLQLRVDYRLGGMPRYYISGEADRMRVSEVARKCAAFVCYEITYPSPTLDIQARYPFPPSPNVPPEYSQNTSPR